ncbi:MAG TPA: carboxypeptidase-like regulatory domain-containing protein [Pyrinomonadaceae bacterium]|nr:carboxypeptidase-like regulatory domain-containing protein [Pyrinomonadaceae bacterium]
MRGILKWSLFVLAHLAALHTTQAQSPPLFTIRGEAHDYSGQKVGGVRVCAMPENPVSGKFFPCVFTEADGKFLLRSEEAGKYKLIYDKSEADYMSPNLPFWRHPAIPIQEVVLDSGNANPYVSINIGPKSGVITGKSVDAATGLPVENVTVAMCHAANPSVCFQTSAKDKEGNFRVRAPHVPFTLKLSADGFDDWVGLGGTDRPEAAVSVDSGTTVELPVYFKRRGDAATRAINETEKQPGVNLPAPVQLSPADNSVFDVFPRKTRLKWKAVKGAASYAVEIDYCKGRRPDNPECVNPQPLAILDNPPTTGILTTDYEFNFVGAQPGRWRVWAIDGEGREGFKSSWRRFRYLQ